MCLLTVWKTRQYSRVYYSLDVFIFRAYSLWEEYQTRAIVGFPVNIVWVFLEFHWPHFGKCLHSNAVLYVKWLFCFVCLFVRSTCYSEPILSGSFPRVCLDICELQWPCFGKCLHSNAVLYVKWLFWPLSTVSQARICSSYVPAVFFRYVCYNMQVHSSASIIYGWLAALSPQYF